MLSRGGRPEVRKIKSLCGGGTACRAEVGRWGEEEFAQRSQSGDILIAVGVAEPRAIILREEFRISPEFPLGRPPPQKAGTATRGRRLCAP